MNNTQRLREEMAALKQENEDLREYIKYIKRKFHDLDNLLNVQRYKDE